MVFDANTLLAEGIPGNLFFNVISAQVNPTQNEEICDRLYIRERV